MTDLDNTQIITADESLLQNTSTMDTEASLKIISGADANTYPIGKETIIGRANPSDLVISASSLSKQHAKITYNNGQYFITDLGSSNKTFQNKIQLQPHVCYALHNDDEIKLGDIICSFEEHQLSQTNKNVITETNVDAIPSTQTISDSYDEQEPTQPMKIWNGNTNRLSRTSMKGSDDTAPKENGLTSALIHPPSTGVSNDDDSLVIGGATIPLVIESTQLNNDDQLEIVSSSQTKKTIDDDDKIVTIETTTTTTAIEITDTQAYELEPPGENVSSDNLMPETQAYELEAEPIITDVVETKREEVHQVVVEGNQTIEQIFTRTTTTTTTTITEDENPVTNTLAYDLQPANEETTTTTTTTTTVIENQNLPADTLAYDLQPTHEEMTTTTTTVNQKENPPMQTLAYDLQPTNEQISIDESAPAVCADTQAYDLDEEVDDLSPRPASEKLDFVPVSKLAEQLKEVENIVDDGTPKQQVEVIIDQNVGKEVAENEQMDTNQTDIPATTVNDQQNTTNKSEDAMVVDETNKINTEVQPETTPDLNQSSTTASIESEQKIEEPATEDASAEEEPSSTLYINESQQDEGEEELEADEAAPTSGRPHRGIPRRAARRARGRRGGATRARVVSTRIHGGRRNAITPATLDTEDNNATLEETITTETEESPKKSTTPIVEQKSNGTKSVTTPTPVDDSSATNQTNSGSNIRVSARIKARASTGRNRQFPYTDDYVDLDDLEKQSKTPSTPPQTTNRRSSRGGRSSSAPQKRISLRQQPIDASESPEEETKKQKDTLDVYEQMDIGGENEEPTSSTRSIGRKRKSTTPVASTSTKRSRPTTPQTAPVTNTRRKPTSFTEQSSPSDTITPKRGRKSTKSATPIDQSPEKQASATDRPVRIALSSHLTFDQAHLDTLRQLGFEIMDESCHVDALVVDRIRRTKKFFMCLARGAHILSPTWIEAMIKENRYIPYENYYLADATAETRYGFQLRESVRLAKQRPIFENYKIFCTKDTSPPYDDLKDIIEAAGGKFIDKINVNKPGKDLICIVGQIHKNEYEDLNKKGVPIVSEEFALSGISKQKLDFDAFSLFQNAATTVKSTASK